MEAKPHPPLLQGPRASTPRSKKMHEARAQALRYFPMIYLEDDGTGAAPTPAELEQLQAILLKLQDALSQLLTVSETRLHGAFWL